jgi:26S proteasome regulatory subunit N2
VVQKVKTAVLSTTARANARAKAKEQEQAGNIGEAMETVRLACGASINKYNMYIELLRKQDDNFDSKAVKDAADELKDSDDKPEAGSETLQNLARVTPFQLPYITFPSSGRYQPVRPARGTAKTTFISSKKIKRVSDSNKARHGGGIIMLRDSHPETPVEYIALTMSLEKPAPAPEAATTTTSTPASRAPASMEVEDGPEASPPASFEVRCRVHLTLIVIRLPHCPL